jgi:predicted Zn-dependent protease
MMESIFFVLLLGLLPVNFHVKSYRITLPLLQANSGAQVPPKTGAIVNRCSAKAFTPNYAVEAGVFQSVRWERFPITIWIDSSTVEDTEEMSELRAGLSEWSDATRGVLGVKFVDDAKDAQIMVKMVDRIPGANGRTRFPWTDHGVARLATIEVVHARWSRGNVEIKSRTVQRDAAHEMGHALGIVRHTTTPGTIMFHNAATDVPSRLDLNTIKTKYCELF